MGTMQQQVEMPVQALQALSVKIFKKKGSPNIYLFGVPPTWHQREGIGPVFLYIPAFSLASHQAR